MTPEREFSEVETALMFLWDNFKCEPETTYVHVSVCREMARKEPTRKIRHHTLQEVRTWNQIADECPHHCCVVLHRKRKKKLTFSYMNCEDE